jgi:hypothetical protein
VVLEALSDAYELYEGGTPIGKVSIAVSSEGVANGIGCLRIALSGQELFFQAKHLVVSQFVRYRVCGKL